MFVSAIDSIISSAIWGKMHDWKMHDWIFQRRRKLHESNLFFILTRLNDALLFWQRITFLALSYNIKLRHLVNIWQVSPGALWRRDPISVTQLSNKCLGHLYTCLQLSNVFHVHKLCQKDRVYLFSMCYVGYLSIQENISAFFYTIEIRIIESFAT